MDEREVLHKHVRDMWDELSSARHYAKEAMESKDTNSREAAKDIEMANDEMRHFEMAKQKAMDYVQTNGNPMLIAIWDWECEKVTDMETEVRVMLNMVR